MSTGSAEEGAGGAVWGGRGAARGTLGRGGAAAAAAGRTAPEAGAVVVLTEAGRWTTGGGATGVTGSRLTGGDCAIWTGATPAETLVAFVFRHL